MLSALYPGINIRTAVNGLEAMRAVCLDEDRIPYHIILCDVNMPVMNGYEATKQIRERGHDLPIVAVTANALVQDQNSCIAAGMNGILTKPFR